VLETKLLKPDAVATVKTVSLLDLFTFASPQVFPTESCLESFTICNATVCGLDSRYLDQFTIDGYDLLIRQDVPMPPVEAFVGTQQADGSYLTLPIYLEVCGTETVQKILTEAFRFAPGDALTVDVTLLFTSSSPEQFCRIESYAIVDQVGSTDPLNQTAAALVTLVDGVVTVDPESTFFVFAVMAETVSG